MKSCKTSELSGAALDWAVAKCEGLSLQKDASLYGEIIRGWTVFGYGKRPHVWFKLDQINYSTNWAQGGPIIEREKIDIEWEPNGKPVVMCRLWLNGKCFRAYGPTPLIAAMRCYVASKLGKVVDIPEELNV